MSEIESPFDEKDARAALDEAIRADTAERNASQWRHQGLSNEAWMIAALSAAWASLLKRKRLVVCPRCHGDDPASCPTCAHTPHPGVVWDSTNANE